jgi:hypothetical protein
VKAAGRLVVALLEFASGVEHRENHLERALLRGGMLVHGNATAIVGDRDRAAVLVQRQHDIRREAIHRFVDRVVEDFPDQMMKSGGADAPDVHARSLANRLQPFENGDVFCGVIRHWKAIGYRLLG